MIRYYLSALCLPILLSVTGCSSSEFEAGEKLWLRLNCPECNLSGTRSTEGHAVVRYVGAADTTARARVEVEYVDIPQGNQLDLAQRLEPGQRVAVRREYLQLYEAGKAEAGRREDLREQLYSLLTLDGPNAPLHVVQRAPAIIEGLESVGAPVDAARARGASAFIGGVYEARVERCMTASRRQWGECLTDPDIWDHIVAHVDAIGGSEAIRAAYRRDTELTRVRWQSPREQVAPRFRPLISAIQQYCFEVPATIAAHGLGRDHVRETRGQCIRWITGDGAYMPGDRSLEDTIEESVDAITAAAAR